MIFAALLIARGWFIPGSFFLTSAIVALPPVGKVVAPSRIARTMRLIVVVVIAHAGLFYFLQENAQRTFDAFRENIKTNIGQP